MSDDGVWSDYAFAFKARVAAAARERSAQARERAEDEERKRNRKVGAMSTRDELAAAIDRALVSDHDAFSEAARELSNNDTGRLSDALIAEGWRKKPSRDEVARAIALGVDGVDGEQFDEAAVDYRLEMLQGADAVLALMDRGQ